MSKEFMTKKVNDFGLFLQAILVIIMAILFVISFYIPEIRILANIMLGIVLFTMSHNNEKTYHKKYLTIVYAIAGLAVIIMSFIGA